MPKLLRIVIFVSILLSLLVQSSLAYEIPQRRIDLKPYLNFIFPSNLMENNFASTAVEDDMGIGFGVKARTQITGFWGFVINTSMTDLKVKDNSLSTATIFTAGFYYSYGTSLGDVIVSVSVRSATLFYPSLELSRAISDRISISAELGMPVPNDWFYNLNVKENYKSLSLSLGGAIVF